MTKEYRITKDSVNLGFDPSIPPVLMVDSGSMVTFETDDGRYAEVNATGIMTDDMHGTFNRVTGPVAIRGSKPGDTLRIDIERIDISRVWAVWFPDEKDLDSKQIQIKQLSIVKNTVSINSDLSVPMQPMIGCIGLAPASGISSAYVPAFPWGGNMDLPELKPGATLYLPVQAPGALLSVGDLHAAMGQGEPCDVGLEAGGSATLKLSIEKNPKLAFPRIIIGKTTYCVGMGENYRHAKELAYKQAFEVLTAQFGLSRFDAFAYASARLSIHFGGPASDIVLVEIPAPR